MGRRLLKQQARAKRAKRAGVPLEGVAHEIQGERVQVVLGPLRGITGIIPEGSQTTLVVALDALRKSVAVRINRAQVIPGTDVRERLRTGHSFNG